MSPAGYSRTPLAKKLGIKPGFRVLLHAAPHNWPQLVAPLPDDVAVSSRFRHDVDLVHTFVTKKAPGSSGSAKCP